MGIKYMKFLYNKSKNYIQKVPIKEFRYKKLAIDLNNFLFSKMTSAIRSDKLIINGNNEDVTHIVEFFMFICALLSYKIIPIFVFDGKTTELKNEVKNKRKQNKIKSQEKLSSINKNTNPKDYMKTLACVWTPNDKIYDDLIKLFIFTGCPFFPANHDIKLEVDPLLDCEADIVCGWLSTRSPTNKKYGNDNYCDAVVSCDSDIMLFGADHLIVDNFYNLSNDANLTVIFKQKLLEDINFTEDQLLDYSIISGNEYSKGITGIGPNRAYNIIMCMKSFNKYKRFILNSKNENNKIKKKKNESGEEFESNESNESEEEDSEESKESVNKENSQSEGSEESVNSENSESNESNEFEGSEGSEEEKEESEESKESNKTDQSNEPNELDELDELDESNKKNKIYDIRKSKNFNKNNFIENCKEIENVRNLFKNSPNILDEASIKEWNLFPRFCMKECLMEFFSFKKFNNKQFNLEIDKILINQNDISKKMYFIPNK